MQWEMGNSVNYYKLAPDWDCSFLFPFLLLSWEASPSVYWSSSFSWENNIFMPVKISFIYAKKSRLMPCLLFSWVWISFPAPVKWREEWTLSFLSAWLDITGNGNRPDPIFFPVILTLKILMLEWVLFNPRLSSGHFQGTQGSFPFHIQEKQFWLVKNNIPTCKKNGVYSYMPLKYFQIHWKKHLSPNFSGKFFGLQFLEGRQSFADLKTLGFGSWVINLHKHAAAMWSLP